MRSKNLNKKLIAYKVCICVLSVLLAVAVIMQIAFLACDRIVCWRPDYEMLSEDEMRAILIKEHISDEEYETLYKQTGLTKVGIDRMTAQGNYGISRILDIQSNLFKEHKVLNNLFAPFICTDRIDGRVTLTALEDGDILVTSSTHLSGLRMGHAALVTDKRDGSVLQAQAYDRNSYIERGGANYFTNRVNFMVLSPKCDADTKKQVVDYAKQNLTDIPYDISAGVFTDKNSITRTQCAHIVWYAYKQFGIDLDYGGGLVVTPKDLANSPDADVVQVFGFDLNKMWK